MEDSDSDCVFMEKEESDFGGSSSEGEENYAPAPSKKVAAASAASKKAAPKPKPVASKKKSGVGETGAVDVEALPFSSTTANAAKKTNKEKTIEELYQKKSQIEHILIRPDTYGTLVDAMEQFESRCLNPSLGHTLNLARLSFPLPLFSRFYPAFDRANVYLERKRPHSGTRDHIHTRTIQDF